MQTLELKISLKDWLYIITIGAFFGFFISLFFYFLSHEFESISTLVFGASSAVIIALFSFLFITLSNSYILPRVNQRFWYFISFVFSFLSGALGFLGGFALFYLLDTSIAHLIAPYSLYLSITIGFLTFLVGLILHQFISMKYKHEYVKSETLESKIKALENELNPHFLFNALNSMSELVYIDPQRAEESILNLSKFLRNAVNQESLITIEEELSMVQTYVDIENIRFDDKIKLNLIKSQEMTDIKIPKFSIQLLVENAIKHGYISKELAIIVAVTQEHIKVTNNGKKIEKLSFGTGLSNLSTRLRLLGVGSLEFKEQEQTTFIIKLKGTQ